MPNLQPPHITEFMQMANGGRGRSFKVEGIDVYLPAQSDDEKAKAIATRLSTALEELTEAKALIEKLRARLPPLTPDRLLGTGCVRFLKDQMYLCGNREKGWSSFALLMEGWDDLFRRYDVVVTKHGTDAAGAWWEVENRTPHKEL